MRATVPHFHKWSSKGNFEIGERMEIPVESLIHYNMPEYQHSTKMHVYADNSPTFEMLQQYSGQSQKQ